MRVVLAAVLAAAAAAGCSARNLDMTDAGPRQPDDEWGVDLLSNFEIAAAARINPPRNGVWYSYNDMSPSCLQDRCNRVGRRAGGSPVA